MERLDADTIQSWKKIEEALREAGKTESYFYRRALSILQTGHDPFDRFGIKPKEDGPSNAE